jgi:multidrug efflux pump subunit AcrA (membrane-fusion protein)
MPGGLLRCETALSNRTATVNKIPLEKNMRYKYLLPILLTLALAGCNSVNPTALPTVVLDTPAVSPQSSSHDGSGGVSASGVVVPGEQLQMAFAVSGKVESVFFTYGDVVEAGQVLVQLEDQAAMEAALRAAEFELAQAQQARDDLDSGAELARVQAMAEVTTYLRDVNDAQRTLDNFWVPWTQGSLDAQEALDLMQQRLDEARRIYEIYKYWDEDDPAYEDSRAVLDSAQSEYNAALNRLSYQYDLEVAQIRLDDALNDLETLSAGPDPDLVQLADSRLANAQSQVAAAQAALEKLALAAPISGTICAMNVHGGEWVLPGQNVLVLADLVHLQIETSDLSELDIPEVEMGQVVSVEVAALNQSIPGHVSQISPLADSLGGDVVYKTTIELDTLPEGLRAGMSVEVMFQE